MNKKRPGGRKSWKVETLVRRIKNPTSGASHKRDREELRSRGATELFESAMRTVEIARTTRNDDVYWRCVQELHFKGTLEVFQAAMRLCNSVHTLDRKVGADVLSKLGVAERTFRRETLDQLHKMLKIETEPAVLSAVLFAIGHSQKRDDRRGIKRITAFRDHSSEDVRFGLAFALLKRTDRLSVDTLIYLSSDEDSDVRDWATFGLARQIELDTPEIREAFAIRLNDEDFDTRREAFFGTYYT